MDVRYDARVEATTAPLPAQVPPLGEWLQSYPKLSGALQACALKFIINLPEEHLRTAARVCFELQEAFWYYIDYIWESSKRELPKLNQMNFLNVMMEWTDVLRLLYSSPKDRQHLIQEWREYSKKVPLKGAVLLNAAMDKCLMVQPWKGEKLTFPRGKINEGETEDECAVREVWEETGVDITGQIDLEQFVQADIYGTGMPVQLFIVPGIKDDNPRLKPNTRKEISKIGWIDLVKLPGWDPEDQDPKFRFVGVDPFVPGIKRWVQERRAQTQASSKPAATRQRPRRLSPGVAERAAAAEPAETRLAPRGRRRGANGAKEAAAAPVKELAASLAKDAADSQRRTSMEAECATTFALDMVKVMKEFDLGWERGSERGKQPSSRMRPGS